jgi:translation initiation factor 5A
MGEMDIKHEDAGSLKVGRYIVIDGAACKVVDIQRSAPGKHGHAKFRISAVDLITGSKKIILKTGHDKVPVPIISKRPAQVLSINKELEGEEVKKVTAQIMDMENYQTFDAEVDDDVKKDIGEGQQVTYWDILGRKIIKQISKQ